MCCYYAKETWDRMILFWDTSWLQGFRLPSIIYTGWSSLQPLSFVCNKTTVISRILNIPSKKCMCSPGGASTEWELHRKDNTGGHCTDRSLFSQSDKDDNAGGNVSKVLVKRSLERNMPGWKYNITTDVTEIAWECVDWTNLAQAVVNTVMKILLSLHC